MTPQTDTSERFCTAGLCRRNALHVLKLAWTTHPEIGFDAAGVRWLAGYIESSHAHLDDAVAEEFVQLAGCFYGECMIATFGGEWAWSGDQLGVFRADRGFTFPFKAVARQLSQGSTASIETAFRVALNHLAATDAA